MLFLEIVFFAISSNSLNFFTSVGSRRCDVALTNHRRHEKKFPISDAGEQERKFFSLPFSALIDH